MARVMNDWAHTATILIGRAELKRLSERSDAPGLRQLGLHVGVLVTTGALISASFDTIWLLPAMVAHGIVLVFLFAPLHETIHRTAFRSRALNDVTAFVIGVLLVLPREYFRAFHFAHHRFTQEAATDPELATPKPANARQFVWCVSGLPYWIAGFRGLVERAAGILREPFYATERLRRSVIREARWVLAIYAAALIGSIAAGTTMLLWYWIVPALLGQPMLRLYLLAEHSGCPRGADMLENSRTTYTNALMRFLAWNMPFHAEHHAWPSIPFHALAQTNVVIRDRLRTTAPGYGAALGEIWEAMRAGRQL
jgi:fatty acid desaturase